MLSVGLIVLLAQAPSCSGRAAAAMADGARIAAALALPAAAARYDEAAAGGCEEARIAALYLRGLIAAREAYRAGGSPGSLAAVREVESRLGQAAAGGQPLAEIARVLLMAASAAAQSERDEMETLLLHATELEGRRLAAGDTLVPGVSAHELAGDLWLQVHRFEDALTAYQRAAEALGPTPRIAWGIARTAERLKDSARACEAYGRFVRLWPGPAGSAEVEEARRGLNRDCQPDSPPSGSRPAPRGR